MAVYKTVQREELLNFLREHSQTPMSIGEISESMKNDSNIKKAPGESTVYRLIKELVENGEVKRIVNGSGRSFVYQIVDGENCVRHLHMKCTVCGKLCHMDDEQSRRLVDKILQEDDFEVDNSTVLLGKCSECKNADKSEK